ncbi:uncharacterized protein M6B38_130055 [Iris pallida]|uniref:Transcription termination factor MTEF1, chloroplastic n=1 Tax=Iris pallida TaxID=29817 RepID=A0AAX6G6P3_IRIPA|nr:uncharacterized protein M6B38_130055 [Iris pallida]
MILQVSPPTPPLPPLKLLLRSPTPTSTTTVANPGLRFREKLHFLEHSLRVDPLSALSLNPSLRSAPLSSLLSLTSYLSSSFGLSPLDSGRVFRMYPHLLTCPDPDRTLTPVLHFLLGPADIPFPDLRRSVLRCPRLLVSSVDDQLAPALLFLRRLGFRSLSSQTALLLVSSVERTLLPKVRYLQSLGLSHRDTVRMVLRSPALLTFSIENNFKPKVEFLVGGMGRGVREVEAFPHYFSFSLERRIRPRHRLLVEGGAEGMSLAEMLKPSDGEFREKLLGIKLSIVGEEP